ncbi:phage terminase large subunit [Lasius niger]|uniref:Phage terminase large subunit n=1 Tax=Lasius niger TaxID=67767 RepID=A0A0J7JY79_LASNI|nr:phage terminase large subunit [Lasius niger]
MPPVVDTTDKTFEYEYRYHVLCDDFESARAVIEGISSSSSTSSSCLLSPRRYRVIYADPHFRFRDGIWQTKKMLSHAAVYHGPSGVWFRYVESEERSYESWDRSLHDLFLDRVAHRMNPFVVEERLEIAIDDRCKVYAYRKDHESGLVFELETDDPERGRRRSIRARNRSERRRRSTSVVDGGAAAATTVVLLDPYAPVFSRLSSSSSSPPLLPHYRLTDCVRKSVVPVSGPPSPLPRRGWLVAEKKDGIFGFVYSRRDHIVEKWEDRVRATFDGTSLGDGFVFGAERLEDGTVVLLDVYQVRGAKVAYCDESTLTGFLPSIDHLLPERYEIQRYGRDVGELPPEVSDLIFHDTVNDAIYKTKRVHTIDLVYLSGRFLFPTEELGIIFETRVGEEDRSRLIDGAVYECRITRNRRCVAVRERKDRTTGNDERQIKTIMRCLKSNNRD